MKTNQQLDIILGQMLNYGNYECIKMELSQKNIDYSEIHKLVIFYLDLVIKRKSSINDILNDDITPYPKEVKNEFIHEYYCELNAYEDCLFECIKILEQKNTLQNCLLELDEKINSYESELYPGFLTSRESIIEISIMYSILKKFKVEINQLLTKKSMGIYD